MWDFLLLSRRCGSARPPLVSPAEPPLGHEPSGGDAEGEEDAPGDAQAKRKRRRRKKKRRPAAQRDSSSESGSSSSSSSNSGSTNRSGSGDLVETPSQFSPGELGLSEGGPEEGGEWRQRWRAEWRSDEAARRQRLSLQLRTVVCVAPLVHGSSNAVQMTLRQSAFDDSPTPIVRVEQGEDPENPLALRETTVTSWRRGYRLEGAVELKLDAATSAALLRDLETCSSSSSSEGARSARRSFAETAADLPLLVVLRVTAQLAARTSCNSLSSSLSYLCLVLKPRPPPPPPSLHYSALLLPLLPLPSSLLLQLLLLPLQRPKRVERSAAPGRRPEIAGEP